MPASKPVTGVPQNVSLQQAIDIAVAKSPVLAAARANYQLTQIPVKLARTAAFPNVSATGSTTHSNSGSAAAGRFGGSFTQNALTGNLRQLIYDGGKVIAQIHQARANAVAGAQTYERQLETLALNVAQAYYTALQSQATVQVDQQLVKLNQANEALVQAQVRTGVAPRVDLVTAHVPTVQAQATLITAQGAEAAAFGAFANQLGLDPNTLVRPVNNTPANPSATLITVLPYDQAVTRALSLRPDYLSAQSTVLAAQYNVQAQRAGYFPTLSGSASYGTASTTVNGTNFTPNSSIGLTLSIPLYDQGITRAQTEQAIAQLDLANAQLSQTKLGVELNVQQALVTLLSDQAAVTQTQAALVAAQESLRATQAQYRAGVTNLFNLLQAQTNLTSAETTETNAIFTLRQAEQSYIFALGESSINPASP
jgi:outer membrane protein